MEKDKKEYKVKHIVVKTEEEQQEYNTLVNEIKSSFPEIVSYYNEITGEDVSNVLVDALTDFAFGDNELVTATPISFSVDENNNIMRSLDNQNLMFIKCIIIGYCCRCLCQ